MTKNDERGKNGNRLAKSCFSEDNEDSDSSSNSDYSMEARSSDNRMDEDEGKVSNHNHVGHGYDDKTTYITVETRDGRLEQLKINLDDEDFQTSTSILEYLVERGEINPKSIAVSQGTELRGTGFQRRGSFFDVMRPNKGNENQAIDLGNIEALESTPTSPTNTFGNTLPLPQLHERKTSRNRSDSVITPGLIKNLKKNKKRIIAKDIFTTAVDIEWRYTLLAFALAFFVSWLIFAVLYYIVAAYRGDLLPENLPSGEAQKNGTWRPCVWEMNDFTSAYLFSLETQHTIGYGSRQTTEECPEAVILMSIQSILGVVISCCMAGIVFAKLARPKQRSHTIMFSKNAVVTLRNGELYLLFRVGNMRKSHLIEAHCRAQIIHYKRVSEEGEMVQYDIEELGITTERSMRQKSFEYDSNGSEISESSSEEDEAKPEALLLWPITVSHKIDKHSPLYNMGPKDLLAARFEMVVTLEGIVEPTGNSVQARSSYLPNEILWGHRYQNMMSYNKKKGIYTVDCSNLNAVMQDDTPRISAKQADEKRRLEAKRLAQLRRKISAISQNSLKTPTAKLSVFSNPRSMSKCQSMTDDYGAGRWNEEGIAASMTTSTICDKSEIDGKGSLPTVTVVNVDKRKSAPTSPANENSIWVTATSGEGPVLSNTNSSVSNEISDGVSSSPYKNSDSGVYLAKSKHSRNEYENGSLEDGVPNMIDQNHVRVEINEEL